MEHEQPKAPRRGRTFWIWLIAGFAVLCLVSAGWYRLQGWLHRFSVLQGAVIRRDADPRKQQPIAGAEVTLSDGLTSLSTTSDASGYFKVKLRAAVFPEETLDLSVSHVGYRQFHFKVPLRLRLRDRSLFIASLEPIPEPSLAQRNTAPAVVSNLRIRYTVNLSEQQDIGSAIKTFTVVHHGSVPCNRQGPCSPDGDWKAAAGSLPMDAGAGNEFRNLRASCIAGPCPFTKIDVSPADNRSQSVTVSALDWSDTTTFLVEAEVFHDSIESIVRESYPLIYGQALSFTVPPTQEGVSIEAEMNGTPMVFPLGPELNLSWATCSAREGARGDRSMVYQCALKPGYSF